MSLADFSDAWDNADEGFELLPKGNYTAEITKATFHEASSANGNDLPPRVEIEYTVIDEAAKGRKVWENCRFTDSAIWTFKRFASKLDLPRETLDQAVGSLDETLGKQVAIKVGHWTNKNTDKTYAQPEVLGLATGTANGDAPF